MLSIFPDLLTYGFFAPLLLRLGVGVYFILASLLHFRKAQKETTLPSFWFIALGIGELCIGALFIVGLWTQVAALLGALYSLKMSVFKQSYFKDLVPHTHLVYMFVGIISLSLLLIGAGAFALDLPF